LSGTTEANFSAFGRQLQAYRHRGTSKYEGPISRRSLSRILGGMFSVVSIEKYERGERRPPPHFIFQVVQALGLTEEQEAALVQAAGVDTNIAYLEEYKEVSGSSKINQDVPDEVKRELSDALMRTVDFSVRLDGLGASGFIVPKVGEASEHNRELQSYAAMQDVALIVQVANYHIYLARFERIRHRFYITPANPAGGDISAAFLFTSFAIHAITVEHRLTAALDLQFGITSHLSSAPSGNLRDLHRALKRRGHIVFAEILLPFIYDEEWLWLRDYRNRWMHGNPMQIAELHMNFGSMQSCWLEETTTNSSGAPERSFGFASNTSGTAQTTVEEMLERGVSCFNLMAKQIDQYISLLEAGAQRHSRIAP